MPLQMAIQYPIIGKPIDHGPRLHAVADQFHPIKIRLPDLIQPPLLGQITDQEVATRNIKEHNVLATQMYVLINFPQLNILRVIRITNLKPIYRGNC